MTFSRLGYLGTADGVGGTISKLWTYCTLGWNSFLVVCYMGIMVDLSANESFNSQCIDQISFGTSYCCCWVCLGQFRQMPLAVFQDVTLSLSYCHLTSAVMMELLESSLWFKSAVWCWQKGKGPPFFLPGEQAHVSSYHILSSCHVCQPLIHRAVSEPTSSLVTPGTMTSVPAMWFSTRHTCCSLVSFCRIWALLSADWSSSGQLLPSSS